jgi:3-methyladenine DNA glycosylase AlkD
MNARALKKQLAALGDEEKAAHAQCFFKTGPGQYGEGDRFRGIRIPELRALAHQRRDTPLAEATELLQSPWHEDRLLALMLWIERFQSAVKRHDSEEQSEIFNHYLTHTGRINNWDLVDLSAPNIVGAWLYDKNRKALYKLAKSSTLWERRIAIVATHAFIRRNDFADTLALSKVLLGDTHDLMHKAVGWMLREVGKRDQAALEGFLQTHCTLIPRTALRYAIERFPEESRQAYLRMGK